MFRHPESANQFLDAAYTRLGYDEGSLFSATTYEAAGNRERAEWTNKGDWLALASEVGAERILFVDEDPVIVFCELSDTASEQKIADTYRRVWCMARPQCLFLAIPGELRVYSLNHMPVQRDEAMIRDVQPLEVIHHVADVATKLKDYHRERIEAGFLFADGRFGDINDRADKRLIQDLKTVRRLLLEQGLPPTYAHALIGRSIFIRYLEDRGVLTPTYFEQIAHDNSHWRNILFQDSTKPNLAGSISQRRYDRVLQDKDFTYALYSRLAQDFNGDMFPKDDVEEGLVTSSHLRMLRNFLLGDVDPTQPALFFWAYDFKVIPIELISSIYEEFYHQSGPDDKGTHYTPSSLVEYVLSQILTNERLSSIPKVLDPACGSGIFLVESFRRIVRYQVSQKNRSLSSIELRLILRTQIAGIEINEEAARVAAFSLYLALLHYQEPPDILANPRLPNLLHIPGQEQDDYHYQSIFRANAFGLTDLEREELSKKVSGRSTFQGRALLQRLLDAHIDLPIEPSSVDVIVGNPPWFEAGSILPSMPCKASPELRQLKPPFKYDEKMQRLTITREVLNQHVSDAKHLVPYEYHSSLDTLGRLSDDCFQAERWAHAYHLPVGESGYSQLFIHRALKLVNPDGIVGLLVHSNVLFNQRKTSRKFRHYWLSTSRIYQVANFVHVRRLFFEQATAPFIFVSFAPRKIDDRDSTFVYISMRKTRVTQNYRSVLLAKADRRIVRQSDVHRRDSLWKTYWWGSHTDAALLSVLDIEPKLEDIITGSEPRPAYGYQYGTDEPSMSLRKLKSLRSENTKWYGPLREDWFEAPPSGVKRQPDERIYQGQRLLVIRGVKGSHASYTRLEYKPFSFRHTIYCVPLRSISSWQAKVILGILWSSLGRYRIFMTSGTWGTWYDQTVPSDILSMPIRLPQEQTPVTRTLIKVVDQIRQWSPIYPSLLGNQIEKLDPPPSLRLLKSLDETVFDLFELSRQERDVIYDFMANGFDLFVNGPNSTALHQVQIGSKRYGTIRNLPSQHELQDDLEGYLHALLSIWNEELLPDGEFIWRLFVSPGGTMLGIELTTQELGALVAPPTMPQEQEWSKLLSVIDEALDFPVSRNIFVDGIARVVTDTQIIVIKRNERRLWTRTAAREDAEATLLQASILQTRVVG